MCISYLTIELKGSIPVELRAAIGNRIYGCDDCLEACPWNRFAQAGKMMKDHTRPELELPDLIELLSVTEAQFKQRFEDTPLLRTKRRGLLRNVCVALGNIGDESALPALRKAAEDPEPLIAEHASWAAREIKAGLVWVNGWDAYDIAMPFGGLKESSFGRDRSLHALHKYADLKPVSITICWRV